MGATEMNNRLITTWLLCGSLDIAFAIVATLIAGGSIPPMLRGVAAGPFGDGVQNWGVAGAVAGLVVHFTLMLIMVSVFALLLQRTPLGRLPWFVSGAIYGIGLWLVMYGIVLPARFGTPFPMQGPLKAFVWFLPHVLCVGWPAAWILRPTAKPQ
ncbi:MAG: hypothetical protein ACXWM1_08800 [Candidatus Binataceae bacterium]